MPQIYGYVNEANPPNKSDGQEVPVRCKPDGTVYVTSAVTGTVTVSGTVTADGQYNSTPLTLTTGALSPAALDVNSNTQVVEQYAAVAEDNANGVICVIPKLLASSVYAPSVFMNSGENATLNVKSSAGNVFSVYCTNANAAARWLQIHNKATVPSAGDVPLVSFFIPVLSGVTILDKSFFTDAGIYCSNGIAFAVSTTAGTYTAATAADHNTIVLFK